MPATSTKPSLLESKLYEVKYENAWIIDNLAMAISNKTYLDQLKHEIEVGKGSSMHSKWVLSLEYLEFGGVEKFNLHCKLLKIISDDFKEFLQCGIFLAYYENSDGRVTLDAHRPKVKANKENMKENDHLEVLVQRNSNPNWPGFRRNTKETKFYFKLSIFSTAGPDVLRQEHEFRTKSESMCAQNLAALVDLDSKKFDIKMVCSDGRELKCHKEVLMGTSPVFKAMLEADMSESRSGIINVTDISGKTMAIFMDYMYTGRLKETWSSPNIILELTYAAGKYQIELLLQFLDVTLGLINYSNEAFDLQTIWALKDLAGKLSLKEAEAKLKEIIVEKIKCSETYDDIVAFFDGIPIPNSFLFFVLLCISTYVLLAIVLYCM